MRDALPSLRVFGHGCSSVTLNCNESRPFFSILAKKRVRRAGDNVRFYQRAQSQVFGILQAVAFTELNTIGTLVDRFHDALPITPYIFSTPEHPCLKLLC